MNRQQGSNSESIGLLIAALAGNCIAVAGWWVQPETIFGLMRGLELAETSAALVASAEVTMVALTSILLGFRGGSSHRKLALLGTAIALVGHALSTATSSYYLIIAVRMVAGLGEGCLLAAITAALASTREPDRRYAQVTAGTVAFQACLLALIPRLNADYTHLDVFAVLAVVTLLLAPVVWLFPRDGTSGEMADTSFGLGGIHAYTLVLATTIWSAGGGAMWAFSVAIGEGTTLDSQQVGTAVGLSVIGGIVGGIVAAWLGRRYGRFVPILTGIAVQVLSVFFLVYTSSGIVFVVSLAIGTFCLFFCYPFLLGAAAEIDPRGGCAAAVGGAFILAGGLGPVLGGLLIVWFDGFQGIAWGVLVCSIAALALLRHVHQKSGVLAVQTA